MGERCLTLAVLEQSWHHGKVDEALLERWVDEIRQTEARQKQRPRDYAATWQAVRGARDDLTGTSVGPHRLRCGGFNRDEVSQTGCGGGEAGVGSASDAESLDAGSGGAPGGRLPGGEQDTPLTEDLWRSIFMRLPIKELPKAAAVCRQWRRVVDGDLWAAAFAARWKLAGVTGAPAATSFWRGGLLQFAFSEKLTRGDSVASLAVRYNVQVMDIRRQNNMMSDHGIFSRDRVLIPVGSEAALAGRECFIERDKFAKREVAVLYRHGTGPDANPEESPSRRRAAAEQRLREKVMASLKRSLQCDDGTASYYLAVSEGNVRGAYAEFLEDLAWERRRQRGQAGGAGAGAGTGGGVGPSAALGGRP